MATYYFRNVGTAWNNTSSWSTVSSSGASAGVIPTSLDAVIFDAGSANSCPVSTTNGACLTLTTTGWTGTLTLNVPLAVSGSITLSATTTFAGASYLQLMAAGTFTSNGVTIPYLVIANSSTAGFITTVVGTLTVAIFQMASDYVNATYTFNGGTCNITSALKFGPGPVPDSRTGSGITGTTAFAFTGTNMTIDSTGGGPFEFVNNLFQFANPLTINCTSVTFLGNFTYAGSTFTYTAGDVSWTDTTFIFLSTCTINANGLIFYIVGFYGASTFTLNSDVICGKSCYIWHNGTQTTTINGAFKVYIGNPNGSVGSLLHTAAGGSAITGTATLEFTGKGGTGYWTNWYVLFLSSTSYRIMNWNINITINTGGTIYILDKLNTASNYSYTQLGGSKVFTYTAGNVITKTLSVLPNVGLSFKGATLSVATGHTLIGLNKIAWGRIILAGGGSFTMDEFPSGNATVVTQMTSSSTTNYTITLTSTSNKNERVANFIRVKNCTLAAANRNQVILTHPKANLGRNLNLRYYDVMNHGIPKFLETAQPKYKSGKEIAYGAMGLVSDPNFASI